METANSWLRKNGYEDIADLIDKLMADWKAKGNHTRRNWWDKLCGDKKGNPQKINGVEIPVLRAAQIRQGVPITKSAICRNENEIIPEIRHNTRWSNKLKS